ncbi:MAG: leucyl aminopeptidase [Cellulosilyticaceae bacterium]
MIQVQNNQIVPYKAILIQEGSKELQKLSSFIRTKFEGKVLQTAYEVVGETLHFYIGIGDLENYSAIVAKEIGAKVVKGLKELGCEAFEINLNRLIEKFGEQVVTDVVEGMLLGGYMAPKYGEQESVKEIKIYLSGINEERQAHVQSLVDEISHVVKGVAFARDLVNKPGNLLRPSDFVDEISKCFRGTAVEVVVLDAKAIEEAGMKALIAVGGSSENQPYFVVLRYLQDETSDEIMGLVGKGVTCDTGGYCLKSAGSMLGIKGDMAGAAAVIGAVYGLASNHKKANVIACLPICENRISAGSLLPGDVISSLAGKTIEVVNTDAEGRLILADAVTYAVQKEKVTKVLDIATLTGAVVGLLGFSIAGVLSSDDRLWDKLHKSSVKAGERYLRVPYYKEHEKMIKSQIADIKNMGESYCGTITAGLFIREFTEGKPWIHLDIAGTAWVDAPVFEYQTKGATGAGVTSIYYLCQKEEECIG